MTNEYVVIGNFNHSRSPDWRMDTLNGSRDISNTELRRTDSAVVVFRHRRFLITTGTVIIFYALITVYCNRAFAHGAVAFLRRPTMMADDITTAAAAPYSFNLTSMTTSESVVFQYHILKEEREALTFGDIAQLFSESSSGIHDFFYDLLLNHFKGDNRAYFFECPAVTLTTLNRAFEFVLIPSKALEGTVADSFAFKEHLSEENGEDCVVSFRNIGGDASLVAPCLQTPSRNMKLSSDRMSSATAPSFAHLAAFVRSASSFQVTNLWRKVFQELLSKLSSGTGEKIWISTSGLGVPWLHVRLDTAPKYYNWLPYRNA